MEADLDAATPSVDESVASRRRGIGLCLSGGGYRATLFHAGVIQRLFELGVTSRPDFHTVASVSGGSLTSAQWAIAQARADGEKRPVNFVADVMGPLQALTSRDIRTGAMAQKFLLPWNWFRASFAVESMVSKFEGVFGKSTLDRLPEQPRFILCGTDMAFGANFVFERDRVGSYLAGYAPSSEFTLAQAVAASACFPPLFGPLRIERGAERFKGGRVPGLKAAERKQALADLRVTDGGVYDNMGLEPVWKSHNVVLVSDAGGLLDAEADKSFIWRIKRYQSIQEAQARGVRKRFLIAGFCQGTIKGAYIGVGSSVDRYGASRPEAYSKAFATDLIANIRTDLDAFSEVEQAVLINHGYTLIDSALRAHAPDLIAADASFVLPFPAFAPPAIQEDELRNRLAGSEKRKLKGRD
ncbi:MAG: patatin-like phospholipase family protein [Vicinamibacteria bacterium]